MRIDATMTKICLPGVDVLNLGDRGKFDDARIKNCDAVQLSMLTNVQ